MTITDTPQPVTAVVLNGTRTFFYRSLPSIVKNIPGFQPFRDLEPAIILEHELADSVALQM